MTVKELIDRFSLTLAAGEKGLDREIKGGHCGDLLSEVMGNAPIGSVWITIQSHQNIVAVAVLREMAAIVLSGENTPDEETKNKADEEGIPILLWPGSTYDLAGQLFTAGLTN